MSTLWLKRKITMAVIYNKQAGMALHATPACYPSMPSKVALAYSKQQQKLLPIFDWEPGMPIAA